MGRLLDGRARPGLILAGSSRPAGGAGVRVNRWAEGVDAALEASIVGSFTRVGLAVRQRLGGWSDLAGLDRAGRVIVISGATSGLGRAAAGAWAAMGATVVLVARNADKAAATCAELRAASPSARVDFHVADTADLGAIRRVAAALLAAYPRIDALVHNAGALDRERAVTRDGIEQTVACHVVGPFLLTQLLRPALGAGSRVLWVSSGGLYSEPLAVDRLEMDAADYDGVTAYARAKRAQATLSALLAPRLAPVVVHAMHPGWADTPGVSRSLPTFRRIVGGALRTPAEGADTLVWLAVDDGLPLETTGLFWHDRRPRPLHRGAGTQRSDTDAERAKLWAWGVARSGWATD